MRGKIDFLRGDLPPGTPPERCAAKLCFFWLAEQLPSIFLSPNGERNVVQNLSQNDNILNSQAGEDVSEIHIYLSLSPYIYIYIERERERCLRHVFPSLRVQYVVILGSVLENVSFTIGAYNCSARQKKQNFAAHLSGGV